MLCEPIENFVDEAVSRNSDNGVEVAQRQFFDMVERVSLPFRLCGR